jgi:hypothetical protein
VATNSLILILVNAKFWLKHPNLILGTRMMGYSQNRSKQKNLLGGGFNHGSSVGADLTLEPWAKLSIS